MTIDIDTIRRRAEARKFRSRDSDISADDVLVLADELTKTQWALIQMTAHRDSIRDCVASPAIQERDRLAAENDKLRKVADAAQAEQIHWCEDRCTPEEYQQIVTARYALFNALAALYDERSREPPL